MIAALTAWLEHIALSIPLPLFVVAGGLIEEIVAPIPSPFVSTMSGGIAASQHQGILYVLFICAIATAAKTVGAWLFYVIGDKLEDVAVPRFGKYIGVKHEDVERFGSYFHGSWKDIGILLLLRSIPVMPSTPISLVCGILKIDIRTFFVSTYIGFYIRNLFFIMLGYTGLDTLNSFMSGINTAETVMKFACILLVTAVLGWLYWKRSKGHPFRLPKAFGPKSKQ